MMSNQLIPSTLYKFGKECGNGIGFYFLCFLNSLFLGHYGKVFIVTNAQENEFAAKRITLIRSGAEEARKLKKLQHESIIGYVADYGESKCHVLVMELAECSMGHYLKENHAEVLQNFGKYARQICSAVSYIHEKGIVHRDIYVNNFLKVGKMVKLADFGSACYINQCNLTVSHFL
jgi:serine/threonine protein kinase